MCLKIWLLHQHLEIFWKYNSLYLYWSIIGSRWFSQVEAALLTSIPVKIQWFFPWFLDLNMKCRNSEKILSNASFRIQSVIEQNIGKMKLVNVTFCVTFVRFKWCNSILKNMRNLVLKNYRTFCLFQHLLNLIYYKASLPSHDHYTPTDHAVANIVIMKRSLI